MDTGRWMSKQEQQMVHPITAVDEYRLALTPEIPFSAYFTIAQ
jgi:hypothetical protein